MPEIPFWLWSYVLSAIGLLGFWLAGRKVWYAWWINVANQVLWTAYALITDQLGFLLASGVYAYVFTRNAIRWTKDRHLP
jgi:hypothetical protein